MADAMTTDMIILTELLKRVSVAEIWLVTHMMRTEILQHLQTLLERGQDMNMIFLEEQRR